MYLIGFYSKKNFFKLYKFDYYKKSFIDLKEQWITTIYFYKADCLLKINKPEDALTLINQALDIVTTDVRLWILRARIYFKLMQYDNTVRDINKSLSVDEVPEAYYVRSMAYKELGEKEKACKDFNRAVSSGYKETQSDMINYCENEK